MGAWVGVRACVVASACCTFDYRCWPFAWHLMRFGPDLVCQWYSLIVAIDATVATSFADSQRLLPTCHFPLGTHHSQLGIRSATQFYYLLFICISQLAVLNHSDVMRQLISSSADYVCVFHFVFVCPRDNQIAPYNLRCDRCLIAPSEKRSNRSYLD